jgi:hypothetical protein
MDRGKRMIDYEKLKLAHELAKGLNERISINVCFFKDEHARFVMDGLDSAKILVSTCIDDLIAKLQRLTCDKEDIKS